MMAQSTGRSVDPHKSITVSGASGSGKKAIIGVLLHECGLEWPQFQKLAKHNFQEYDEIVPYCKQNDVALTFYDRSTKYAFGESKDPNILLWVVDASQPDQGKESSVELKVKLESGELKPKEKLVVIVNKMDKVDWMEEVFRETACLFHDIKAESAKVSIVPVAATKGGNVVQSPEASWVKEDTMQDDTCNEPEIASGKTLMETLA